MKLHGFRVRCLPLQLFVLLSWSLSMPAVAQFCWTTAASAGTIDLEDNTTALLLGPHLHISSTATLPASVGARYNVTGIKEDVDNVPSGKYMRVRYRDNGTSSRVFVYLKQVRLSDGAVTDLIVFDSDSYAQSTNFQSVGIPLPNPPTSCAVDGGFHFIDYLYFIRVDLGKTDAGGEPSLHSIQICEFTC